MKNQKRMLAVIAASGLALGSLPGVANAQSEGLLDLNLGVNVGDSVEVGVNLGLGSLGVGPGDYPSDGPLAGSLDNLDGAGSSELSSGSDDFGPALEEALEAGSSGGSGSDFDDLSSGSDFDDLSSGSDSASDDLPSGSDSASDDLPSGSDSASDELEEELDGGLSSDSLGSDSEGSSGSDNGGDTADPSIFDRISEWISDLFDSGSDSASDEAGSDSASDELEEELGGGLSSDSLGSDSEGSSGESETPGSSGLGSSDNEIILGGGSDDLVESSQALGTGSGVGAVAAVGSLALPAVAIGIAVSGNAGLPPLPEVNVGAVCNLPPEAIDFLKGNGSMEPEECLPPEEQPAP
ncbi:MAG TPA: hypothetical protein H9878_00100 [Candidatus Dietzia merdigallinarum]|nr:hypothetical protein [Candidatus Dietzia merdigallinarum]